MLIFMLILLIITAFTFNDLVPVYRNRKWKVFWIYIGMMTLMAFVSALIRLNIDIPSPAEPLRKLVISIFGQYGEL